MREVQTRRIRCGGLPSFLALLGLVGTFPAASANDAIHTIDQATAALMTHDGFQFRAVASEPLVVDPVSARLDGQGRLWVVEMPDYPTGPPDGGGPNGRIKILEDLDQDGCFDRFDLFAEGLEFATGVQPYRDGAFVTLAGQIVFISDSDGDRRGDETFVLFRGFAEQNQQLRANHPTLGPDGLIYVANGLRGGSIEAVDARFTPRDQPVDLRDRDFAFDPEGGWWGAVSGNSQFGLTIDDFGRRIGCSNRNPAMTAPLAPDAIARDPLYAARDAVLDVAAAAEKSRVVSRADAWTTSNLHAGQFSAACGVFAPGVEDAKGEWMLVCEPTAYLVQLQRIDRLGSVWQAERAHQEAEYFASTDTWFRPVDLAAGPDTSVFVVDMSRAVIEHPDFMPPELKSRPDQRDGDDLGRIWQVAANGAWPSPQKLDSSDQAIQWLDSKSPWQRQMASQFFLESQDDDQAILGAMVLDESSLPQGRARAAQCLHRRGALTDPQLRTLLAASDGRLRALAIELASGRAEWLEPVLALSSDNDPLVRRYVGAVAGKGTDRPQQRSAALAEIALEERRDEWIRRTVASAEGALLADLAQRIARAKDVDSSLLAHLIERLAAQSPDQAAAIMADVRDRNQTRRLLDVPSVAMLEAWVSGNRRERRSIRSTLDSLSAASRDAMTSAFESAAITAEETAVDASLRGRCVGLAIAAGWMPNDLRDVGGAVADGSSRCGRPATLAK